MLKKQSNKFKKKEQKLLRQQREIEAKEATKSGHKDYKAGENEYVKDLDTVEALERMLDNPEDSVSDAENEQEVAK